MYISELMEYLNGCEAIGFDSHAMSRIVNSILLENDIPNRIMAGDVTYTDVHGSQSVTGHSWVEIEEEGVVLIVDYCLEKQVGHHSDLPRGIFILSEAIPLHYKGAEIPSTYEPDPDGARSLQDLERELDPVVIPQPGHESLAPFGFMPVSLQMH